MRSPSYECRVSGMEAPETVQDGADVIGRREPDVAGYRADGGESPTPLSLYTAYVKVLLFKVALAADL